MLSQLLQKRRFDDEVVVPERNDQPEEKEEDKTATRNEALNAKNADYYRVEEIKHRQGISQNQALLYCSIARERYYEGQWLDTASRTFDGNRFFDLIRSTHIKDVLILARLIFYNFHDREFIARVLSIVTDAETMDRILGLIPIDTRKKMKNNAIRTPTKAEVLELLHTIEEERQYEKDKEALCELGGSRVLLEGLREYYPRFVKRYLKARDAPNKVEAESRIRLLNERLLEIIDDIKKEQQRHEVFMKAILSLEKDTGITVEPIEKEPLEMLRGVEIKTRNKINAFQTVQSLMLENNRRFLNKELEESLETALSGNYAWSDR